MPINNLRAMSLSTSSQQKPFDNYLSFLLDAYRDDPLKNIAVLFTDVVGSTNYFKKYGDMDGREMLRQHQNLATSIIHEYRGNLIKAIGDSVMASFSGPSDALRSAIKMQRAFRAYNDDAPGEHQIHIRIGVHFGKVIVEEKDIYGDVVNVAAKLTNLADGDEIYISQEVYELAQDIQGLHFELVNLWSKKDAPSGLTMYKAAWENAPIAEPTLKTFLHARLLPETCETDLSHMWEDIAGGAATGNAAAEEHEGKYILPDKSLVLVLSDSTHAISTAESIAARLGEAAGKDMYSAPALITICRLPHIKGEAPPSHDLAVQCGATNSGGIYISHDVYLDIKDKNDVSLEPLPREEAGETFYKVIGKNVQQDAGGQFSISSQPFFCQKTFADGAYAPCFYCGGRKHHPSDCPSKNISGKSSAIHQLGYLSLDAIKKLLLSSPDNGCLYSEPAEQLHLAFYELKGVFQLPFLRTIWNNPANRWEKVKQAAGRNEGGTVWLIQDSIRVSDHARARSLLEQELETFPEDYKVYCLAGYLNIEENNLPAAKEDFKRAHTYTKTNPQKIFVLFQLARIYALLDNPQKAQEKINGILAIDPGCTEATYQDIIMKLRQKKEKIAIQHLANLVRDNRDYYVAALIDPDMQPYHAFVLPQLQGMLNKIKTMAQSRLEEAHALLKNTAELLGQKKLAEIEPLLEKVEELMKADSYFGYLDSVRYSDLIIAACENTVKEQKKDLSDIIDRLSQRLQKAFSFVKKYRYRHLVDAYYKRLMVLKIRMDDTKGAEKFCAPWQFEACHALCKETACELDAIEPKLKRLEILQHMIRAFFNFLKHCSAMLSIVFFIGIFVFPFFVDPLNILLSKFDVTSISNAWSFQKTFLVLGGITSFIASFLMSVKDMFKDDRDAPSL